jgi:hypothetical protein
MAHIPAAAAVVTAAVVPLAGWTIHSIALHRRLAAAHRDPLTGAYGRDGFTAHATSLLRAYGDQVLIAFADLDHVDRTTAGHVGVSGDVGKRCSVRDVQPSGGEVVCLRLSRSTAICGRSNFRCGVASYRLTT